MKANVLVSHLWMDDGRHVKGDIVDYPPDRIRQLGSSVKSIDIFPEPEQEPVQEPVQEPEQEPEQELKESPKDVSTPVRRTRKSKGENR